MDNYQLAKLVQWAGTLQTRKKMQKVVFLLQAAGCPFDAEFFLHHYGPYSTDVARLTDSLVNNRLLNERMIGNPAGAQYEYELPSESQASLTQFEQTDAGKARLATLQPFERQACSLLKRNVGDLEYASTIAYFKSCGQTWDEAYKSACQFKKLDPNGGSAKSALFLAKSVMEPSG